MRVDRLGGCGSGWLRRRWRRDVRGDWGRSRSSGSRRSVDGSRGLHRRSVDAGGLLGDNWSVGWGSLGGGGGGLGRSSLGSDHSRRRGHDYSAGGGRLAGLLVEFASAGGSGLSGRLVVPDGGVDNDGLSDDLGLVDKGAPVERRSHGVGAEKDRSEDSGCLHFDGW